MHTVNLFPSNESAVSWSSESGTPPWKWNPGDSVHIYWVSCLLYCISMCTLYLWHFMSFFPTCVQYMTYVFASIIVHLHMTMKQLEQSKHEDWQHVVGHITTMFRELLTSRWTQTIQPNASSGLAEKHKDSLTPGSRIKGMPDGVEKHKGSHLGVATRSRRITFLENKASFPNAIQDLTIDLIKFAHAHFV